MKKRILPILLSVPLGSFGNPMEMHKDVESLGKLSIQTQAAIEINSIEEVPITFYSDIAPSSPHMSSATPYIEERSILNDAIGSTEELVHIQRTNLSHVQKPKGKETFFLVRHDHSSHQRSQMTKTASVDVFGFTTPKLQSEAPIEVIDKESFEPKAHPLEIFPTVNSNMSILLGIAKASKAPAAKLTALRIADFVHDALIQPKRLFERAMAANSSLDDVQIGEYLHRPQDFENKPYLPNGESFEQVVSMQERQVKVVLNNYPTDEHTFNRVAPQSDIPLESTLTYEKQAIASRLTNFVHNALHHRVKLPTNRDEHQKEYAHFTTHSYQEAAEVQLASHTPNLSHAPIHRENPYYHAHSNPIAHIESAHPHNKKASIQSNISLNPHSPIIRHIQNSKYDNTKKLLSRFLPNEESQNAFASLSTTEVKLESSDVEVRFADWKVDDEKIKAIPTQNRSKIKKESTTPQLAVKPDSPEVNPKSETKKAIALDEHSPNEEEINECYIDFGQEVAFEPVETPTHSDSFETIENKQTPVAIESHYRVPKSSHSSYPSVNLRSNPVESKEVKPLKSLLTQFDPSSESNDKEIETLPLLVRNIKHLNPNTQKPTIFSIKKLQLQKPLLVMHDSTQEKVLLPHVDSTHIETNEPLITEIRLDVKPLAFKSYIAIQEESKVLPAGILTHQLKLNKAHYEKAYRFNRQYSDHIAVLSNYTTPKAPREITFDQRFKEAYISRRDTLNTTFTIEEKALFNFPQLNVNVTAASADVKQDETTITTKLKLIEVQNAHDLSLHTPGLYDSIKNQIGKTSLYTSYDHANNEKEHLEMERNPLHSLSFLKKIDTQPHVYTTELYKPLPTVGSMCYETHKQDLMNSIAQFKTHLPTHSNRFTDYIDLLSINEAHFDPNLTQSIEKTKADFSELFEYGREEQIEAFAQIENESSIPSLYDLNTQVLTSEFKTDVEVIAKPNSDGYYFSLKIAPYFPEELRRIRQNIYFVIDQSRSISKERFNTFKKSILRALPYVNQDDTFNIIVFDKHFESLGEENLYYSKETLAKARRFLDNVRHGSLSPPKDYYKAIRHISEKFDPDSNELNVVLLLTDGAAYKAHHLQKDKVRNLTEINNNQFAIHTISAAQNNYLSALDLVSFMNHGTMLHSKSHAALPRQLAILVKHLRYPLATDLNLSILSSNSDQVKFFTDSGHLQNFYGHKPLTIYGEADSLCEFKVMLQGKCEEEWVNITQSVNLQQASPADRELIRNTTLLEKKVRKLFP